VAVFERFTDRARKVMVLAQEEARLMDHGHIGTEHLLLGLLNEGEGVGAKALGEVGITLQAAREQVEQTVMSAPSAVTGSPPFSPRAKTVLELSLREALALEHNYIGTEHLLLGIVKEGEGVASQVLTTLGADGSKVRHAVLRILSGFAGGGAADGEPPLCPHCGAGLKQHASSSTLEVGTASFLVVYCGECGKALAFKPEA
jgi:ATP-dependent Clp protease ATP-binding subunit ClpC